MNKMPDTNLIFIIFSVLPIAEKEVINGSYIIQDKETKMIYSNCYYSNDMLFGYTFKKHEAAIGTLINYKNSELNKLILTVYTDSSIFNLDSALVLNIKNGHRGLLYKLEECYYKTQQKTSFNTLSTNDQLAILNPIYYYRIIPSNTLNNMFVKKFNSLLEILEYSSLTNISLIVESKMISYYIKNSINLQTKPVYFNDLESLNNNKLDITQLL